MQLNRLFTHLLFFLALPAMLLPSGVVFINETPSHSKISVCEQLLTYDDLLLLIEDIETGQLEKRCDIKDLEEINALLTRFAEGGILPGQEDLQNDIDQLLNLDLDPYRQISTMSKEGCLILPAISYGQAEMVLCKSWTGKQWNHTKKFVKKHKKAILIGAAIAVAATVVVCAVIAYSSAAAAAGAIGAVAAAVEHDSPKIERQPLSTVCDPLIEDQVEASLSDAQALDEAPGSTIKENAVELASQTVHIALSGLGAVADLMVIQDDIFLAIANRLPEEMPGREDLLERIKAHRARQLEVIKNTLVEGHKTIDEAFGTGLSDEYLCSDIGRSFLSQISHESFDYLSDCIAPIPEIMQMAVSVLGKQDNTSLVQTNPAENFKKITADGHGVIDEVFDTQMAGEFTPEYKAAVYEAQQSLPSCAQRTLAILPPPGKDYFGKVAARSGSMAQEELTLQRAMFRAGELKSIATEKDILAIIKPDGSWIGLEGTKSTVRIFKGNHETAEQCFQKLIKDAEFYFQNEKIKIYTLADGTRVGYRKISTSGPPTIDVVWPDKRKVKLKFKD